MKKQLLVAAMAALVAGNAWALIDDRTVHNNSSHVIFVAWKSGITSAKSNYERILPGEYKTFGVADRGSGLKGGWGNTIQVDLGGTIGKNGQYASSKKYKDAVNAKNKKMDKWKEAFVKDSGNDIEITLSGELATASKES